MQRKRGLTRGFRPVNFNNAPFGQAANTKGKVKPERARGYDLNIALLGLLGAEAHDGALAEGPFDLAERGVERLSLIHTAPLMLESNS